VEPPARIDTLQNSRERVAARWFALKGIFEHGVQEQAAEKQAQTAQLAHPPLVAIFSLAGGVGKTSMVATLGRALSNSGEKVLLTDTTSHGLLPFYFGASELKPGVMRTFSPPAGSSDAPIYLLSYDVLHQTGDASSADWFSTELTRSSSGTSRVLLDLSAAAPWVARRLAEMDATVLIPLAPDMNSVISLGAMEKFFSGMKDGNGKQIEPFYVLNQFDSSLALHLDVREVMRQQLDDRLLPFTIRRAPAVPEALAEGMTVVDYSPESAITEDYRNLASWLKSRSAPAVAAAQKNARWSER
jgi:cellulose synthase operon protein YhjQ